MLSLTKIFLLVITTVSYSVFACSCGCLDNKKTSKHSHDHNHAHENHAHSTKKAKAANSVHSYEAKSISGQNVSLEDYDGKVLLIVNTASKCGLTPQYKGLEKLYKTYKARGFEVLGFPCNQFGGQEPGTEEQIKNFCSLKYGVTFPMFKKVDVNGKNAHPLFTMLKNEAPGSRGGNIGWNFTKFLVNRKGEVVKRYAPMTKPNALTTEIESLLAQAI